jgi:hypothetical protein
LFEGNDNIIELEPGDYINIPAHLKHRVEWTDPDIETVWLAVMWRNFRDIVDHLESAGSGAFLAFVQFG